MNIKGKGLGRLESPLRGLGRRESPDSRDRRFPFSLLLGDKPLSEIRTVRYWDGDKIWLDQGSTPQCVGYSFVHWVVDGPVTHGKDRKFSNIDPTWVYYEAQKVDEWDGVDYDGTSVRAGAKVLQTLGVISTYYWAWDAETVVKALLNLGPVVVGTIWYNNMFTPDDNGIIKPSGSRAGGHAYVLNGVDMEEETVRLKNSWGTEWGKGGYAFLSFKDLSVLLSRGGEACIAEEVASPCNEPNTK